MIIEFYKYQGTGNDFIIIDDRKQFFNIKDQSLIAALCERKMGIGADGLILLQNHDEYDFKMVYFNSNGEQSSMCGNGGRCIVAFANMLEIISDETTFLAVDGIHQAKITQDDVLLKMNDVKKIESMHDGFYLDTGSPHFIKIVDNLEGINVVQEGRVIRNSELFKKNGVNVNFVSFNSDLEVRTYERGVEDETLSCGTGVVAVAIAMHYADLTIENTIEVKTRGGILIVGFEYFKGVYRNVWLSGNASMVYGGDFEC